MLQHDQTKELRRRFLLTCVQRNRNAQLRLKALGEIADLKDADAFDDAIDIVGTWSREDKRAGTKVLLQALVDKRIGRRDQAQAWVWRLADYTRELHEEYAVQRWPETKRLLGLLVNSAGRAHGKNARRLVQAARKQDRRLAVALLAAAVAHTPEGEEVLRGARMRMARKPSAVARELLRNFPKGGKRRRKRKRGGGERRWRQNGAGVRTSSSRTASGRPEAPAEIETEQAPARQRRESRRRGDGGRAREQRRRARGERRTTRRPRPESGRGAAGDEDAKPAKAKAKRKAAAKAKEAKSPKEKTGGGETGESQSFESGERAETGESESGKQKPRNRRKPKRPRKPAKRPDRKPTKPPRKRKPPPAAKGNRKRRKRRLGRLRSWSDGHRRHRGRRRSPSASRTSR